MDEIELICWKEFLFSGASVMLAELAIEAGLPSGVLNVVHGTNVRFYLKCFYLLFVHFSYTIFFLSRNVQKD